MSIMPENLGIEDCTFEALRRVAASKNILTQVVPRRTGAKKADLIEKLKKRPYAPVETSTAPDEGPDASSSSASVQSSLSSMTWPTPTLRQSMSGNHFAIAKRHSNIFHHLWSIILERASSVGAVRALVLLWEAMSLSWNLTRNNPRHEVIELDNLPYQWFMRNRQYWAPVTLWLLIGLILPFVFGHIFNPTRQSHQYRTADPFVFSFVRFILAWVVYWSVADLQETTEGVNRIGSVWQALFSESAGIVCKSLPGGFNWLLMTPLLCMLYCPYGATLSNPSPDRAASDTTHCITRKLRSASPKGRKKAANNVFV
ncbi:hypothetical protein E8E12_000949 [Didymella heteroderae]|uniref:Uncharacterized protein n=1 Tax=Didymella heteroderae TaxID=1769908 RepID=A0A9P4WG40_9PLEO|nr:hypothetical protein E8E12_000949 [Didymella heteroderae]